MNAVAMRTAAPPPCCAQDAAGMAASRADAGRVGRPTSRSSEAGDLFVSNPFDRGGSRARVTAARARGGAGEPPAAGAYFSEVSTDCDAA